MDEPRVEQLPRWRVPDTRDAGFVDREGARLLKALAAFVAAVGALSVVWPAFGRLVALLLRVAYLYVMTGARG